MIQKSRSRIFHDGVFKWTALVTGAILLIPLIAMQITTEVAWDSTDFIVMGSLLFCMSNLFVLAVQKLSTKHRLFVGAMVVVAFLYIWAELAVGVLTNLGS